MLFFSKEKNEKLISSVFCSICCFFSKNGQQKTHIIRFLLNMLFFSKKNNKKLISSVFCSICCSFQKRITKKFIPSIFGLIMLFFSKKNNKKLLHPFAAYVRLAHGILCFKIFGTGFFFPYRFDHNNIGN